MPEPEHAAPHTPEPPHDLPSHPEELPKVEPPTAGFIVQLFLIPALIIACIVAVWLLFGQIAQSSNTPEDYLSDLRSPNREKRWNAARQLAFELPRNTELQNSDTLARGIAALYESELARGPETEESPEIRFLEYLAMALGELPAGLPALERSLQPQVPPSIRAIAVMGIGRLAHRIGELPETAITTLAAAARDDEAEIRKVTARALGLVESSAALETLTSLLNDADLEVRYNAAASMAKLGSTESMDILKEMLDLTQHENKPAQLQESIPIAAIESLAYMSERNRPAIDPQVVDLIATAARQGSPLVQARAKDLLLKLDSLQ